MLETFVKYWQWIMACFAVYFTYGCMVYFEPIKRSPYYIGIGLVVALIGNLTWLYFARQTSNATEMLYIGLLWDLAIMLAFMAAGGVLGAVHLSWNMLIGLCLILVGSTMLKL